MDLNLVVLSGRLSSVPELRELDSGHRLLRLLVAVRSEQPRRRLDVLPVTLWDPPLGLIDSPPEAGARIWVAGAVQRRFWEGSDGRRSRLEVVADQVTVREELAVEAGSEAGED